jgi:hypothetical protein
MMRAAFLVFLAASMLTRAAFSRVIVFENVNVLPMDKDRVMQRQTARVEAGGKYLIPGLAEMHGHLPSLLSHLRFCNSFPGAADLIEDHIGSGLPYMALSPFNESV